MGDFNFTLLLTRKVGRVCWLKSERLMRQTRTSSTFCFLRIFLLPFIVSDPFIVSEGRQHDASTLTDSGLLLVRRSGIPSKNLLTDAITK